MPIFKCKICGGALEVDGSQSVATCQYCGMKQTLPRLDDERRANLYDRANHFRRNNDFDKAMSIYEQILNEDTTDAEAYWSIVLCRYGIEYVEDPATRLRVPTVNRAQFTSIFDDENYKSAIQHADEVRRDIYEAEAATINEIQKGILAISQKEEPFDVFICYKETDSSGRRTQDSVLATELYHELIEEGYKVFFSRITLEDKLGIAYEPYIFAALNSAKVMVVLGTRPEHFNAVWVKNEWSRYLALIRNGAKKSLIPAYRDMDPYDLPEEFSHLQAQDMSKLGFMQDLIHGINKIVDIKRTKASKKEEAFVAPIINNIAPLLKRAFMSLEDGEFDRADEFCEMVLNQDPENARAYLGKLMASLQVRTPEKLAQCAAPFDKNNNYKKIIRFGSPAQIEEIKKYNDAVKKHCEYARLATAFGLLEKEMNAALTTKEYERLAGEYEKLGDFKDADKKANECRERARQINEKNLRSLQSAIVEVEKSITSLRTLATSVKDMRRIGWSLVIIIELGLLAIGIGIVALGIGPLLVPIGLMMLIPFYFLSKRQRPLIEKLKQICSEYGILHRLDRSRIKKDEIALNETNLQFAIYSLEKMLEKKQKLLTSFISQQEK